MSEPSLTGPRTALAEQGFVTLDPDVKLWSLFDGIGRLDRPILLRSTDRDAARGWCLSGTYGRGAFPWHTDGAISSHPPRWLVLRPMEVSEATATELLRPTLALRERLRRTVLIARDHANRTRYLPALMPTNDGHRLRWDPRTCKPLSTSAAIDLDGATPSVVIRWELGRTLVIDNHRVLHRRPAVAAAARRVLERTYVWSL